MEQRMSGCFWLSEDSIATMPVLSYPDTRKPYILYMDARNNYIGACLCQEKDTQWEKKSNEPIKKPITICHINLELHRQMDLQLKMRILYLLCSSEIRPVFAWLLNIIQ